ncbi:MAG: hypothetical protein IKW30_00510 [Lachnospiraceae bacterium]|nr:hypothetical protein [Lachnospiraceae bacterium]
MYRDCRSIEGITDYPKASNKKNTPYFDSVSKTWKVTMEHGEEEGDAIYVASEFVKGGLIYPFHDEAPEKEKYHNHRHDFEGVVEFLLKKPKYFSIEGFEEYYSLQEQELLLAVKNKLFENENNDKF